MNRIKLTDTCDDPILVDMDQVYKVVVECGGTALYYSPDNEDHVKESVEEVLRLEQEGKNKLAPETLSGEEIEKLKQDLKDSKSEIQRLNETYLIRR